MPLAAIVQRIRKRYGTAGGDAYHRTACVGTGFMIPVGRAAIARNVSRAVNHVIGGWQVATISDWGSGTWLNVGTGAYLWRAEAQQRSSASPYPSTVGISLVGGQVCDDSVQKPAKVLAHLSFRGLFVGSSAGDLERGE